MEIDLAQLDSSANGSDLLRAEICIIGAGIAGLTLAHKLSSLGHDVLLLESGGRTVEPFPAIEQAGHPHPGTIEAPPRTLGGTSLTWGGQLLPLPEDAQWPITAAQLSPFTSQAERLLGVDDLSADAAAFFAQVHQPVPELALLPSLRATLSKFAPFSHRNLAQTVAPALRRHPKTRIAVHAHATELMVAPGRDRIDAVIAQTPSGRTYRVEAANIIVAAGTVETVRLLLASRCSSPQGIGNQHDQLGRNFHDHLTIAAATIGEPARTSLLAALRPWVYRGTVHALKLSASPELRSQLGLTPVLAHFTIGEPDNSGIGALRNLLRARQQKNLPSTLRKTIPQFPRAIADTARLTVAARAQHRRYVSERASVELRLNAAQRTRSASRITLSPALQPILDWRIDPAELATLRFFAQHLRTRLGLQGIDWNPALFTPEFDSPIANLEDARHTMGGACMGTDQRTSVVDTNLCVHSVGNLFIASAAVFPDGSPQLPTLPLMALTLRLAEHLHALPR